MQEGTPELALRIQKVDVSYNQLSGTISPVASFVPSLRWLDFSGNGFSGQVSSLFLHHSLLMDDTQSLQKRLSTSIVVLLNSSQVTAVGPA